MKIFAPGGFDHRNRGDAALVIAFVDWVQECWPGCDVTVTSFYPAQDEPVFGVPTIDMVTRPTALFNRAVTGALRRIPWVGTSLRAAFQTAYVALILVLLRVWVVVHRFFPVLASRLIPPHVRRVTDEIEAADAVLTIPGGYLIAQRATDTGWLYHLPTLALCTWLGKGYTLGPCSFGPFVGVSQIFARWVWNHADAVYLREERSRDIAAALGLDTTKAIATHDLGFLMTPSAQYGEPRALTVVENLRAEGRLLLGISVRKHNFPKAHDPEAAHRRYLLGIQSTVRSHVDLHPDAWPVIFAQTDEDIPASRQLSVLLNEAGVPHTLVIEDIHPQSLMLLLRQFHVVLGTRMHACILSLCVGTPVVGIAYEPKTPGILATVGLASWSVPIEAVENGEVDARLEARWRSHGEASSAASQAVLDARSDLKSVLTRPTHVQRHIHIFLPGAARRPVGGYKVAYEYANEFARLGELVTIWHTTAFFAETSRHPLLTRVRAVARRAQLVGRGRDAISPWFHVDSSVRMRVTAGLPRPRLRPGDVVISTAIQTVPWANRQARLTGATSVAFIQHYEDWSSSQTYVEEAWAGSQKRVVIAPWLEERVKAVGLDCTLIPNSIDQQAFPRGVPLSERAPMVLAMLSPIPIKRADVVIAALRWLHSRRPDWRLATFGAGSRPTELPDFVEYWSNPSVEQLQTLYQQSRVYICGSDAEGWHLPPAEATLSGAAVVSTDIGGVRAYMDDDALYAPPGDALGLGAAALLACEDHGSSSERVERAFARLTAESVTQKAQRFLAVSTSDGD